MGDLCGYGSRYERRTTALYPAPHGLCPRLAISNGMVPAQGENSVEATVNQE
jgi:hypothetical protein